jgi:hypothetical protein
MAVTMKTAVFWEVTKCGFVRACVSEEHIVSIIKMTRIGELGTTLAVTSNRYIHPKRRFLQQSHRLTSQKRAFFTVTAVNTSNITKTHLLTFEMQDSSIASKQTC